MGGAESITGAIIVLIITGVLVVAGAIWIRIGIALVDDLLMRLARPGLPHGSARGQPTAVLRHR